MVAAVAAVAASAVSAASRAGKSAVGDHHRGTEALSLVLR